MLWRTPSRADAEELLDPVRKAGVSMIMDQAQVWLTHTAGTTVENVVAMTRHPCRFQAEFAGWLNGFGSAIKHDGKLKVCEVGCEYGVTSLLLNSALFEKHCLDFNRHALGLLREATLRLGQSVTIHEEDMFHTSIDPATFDIVFNNGVLEHYEFEKRVAALREYARIVRPNGRILIGVPNHNSPPYRIAYLLRRALGRWPYPPENAVGDFKAEARSSSLEQVGTHYFDKETVFEILPRHEWMSMPFRFLDKWLKFPPYLKVFELIRRSG
jgi:2-polyprenyl-3-methyl-5-hydroxy-6-metoxy-1,4-benzoquinol methylase